MRCFYKSSILVVVFGLSACDMWDKKSSSDESSTIPNLCENAKAEVCNELETQADSLRTAREAALVEGNLVDAIKGQIEVEKILRHLDLYKRGIDQNDPQHVEVDETFGVMLSFVNDDALRSIDDSAVCVEQTELCTRLKADLHTMQNDYILLSNGHNEQALVDRRVELNYRLSLLSAYTQNLDQVQIERLDEANKLLSGIVDRLTIGTGVGYVLPSQDCVTELKPRCQELEGQLASLRNRLSLATTETNDEKVNELTLQLNYVLEILGLHKNGVSLTDPKILAATNRYERLRSLVSSTRPAYREQETMEVRKVTKKYGELFVKEQGWQVVEVTHHKPWAGYWYPFRHVDMFVDENSPLQKFDAVLAASGRSGGAASWEREKQSEGSPWESSDGMCDAWAAAASVTSEPSRSISFRGVTFEPKHIKGLLVQKYARMSKERFGVPYQGRIATDGLSQDLRPEAFHLLVNNMLAQNEIPTVDTDPDFEMWNKPLYKYEWRVTKDPEVPNAFIVDAKAYYVKWRNKPSNDLTNYTPGRESDLSIPQYRYRLVVNPGEVDSTGAAHVIYGEWLVDDLHPEYPDTLFRISPEQVATPRNPVVAANLDVLEELLSQ